MINSDSSTMAIIFITGIALVEIIKLIVMKVFRKIDTEYVTITELNKRCDKCIKSKVEHDDAFKREMRQGISAIRTFLLIVATELKIPADKMAGLVNPERN